MPQPEVTTDAKLGRPPSPGAIVLVISSDCDERDQVLAALPQGARAHWVGSQEDAVAWLQAATGREESATGPRARLVPDGLQVAGSLVKLTPLEHEMLRCLLTPTGSMWSLLMLSEQVWGTSFVGNGSQVRAVLKRLRRKLLGAGTGLQIESVRGIGLRLVDESCAVGDAVAQLPHNCPTEPIAERG